MPSITQESPRPIPGLVEGCVKSAQIILSHLPRQGN
jgi:hypothetical protein